MLWHISIGALVFWMASALGRMLTPCTPLLRTTRNLQTPPFLRRYYPDTFQVLDRAPAISFSMILLLGIPNDTIEFTSFNTSQVVTAAISELNCRQASRATLVKH